MGLPSYSPGGENISTKHRRQFPPGPSVRTRPLLKHGRVQTLVDPLTRPNQVDKGVICTESHLRASLKSKKIRGDNPGLRLKGDGVREGRDGSEGVAKFGKKFTPMPPDLRVSATFRSGTVVYSAFYPSGVGK